MTRLRIIARAIAGLLCLAAVIIIGPTVSAHPTAPTHVLMTVNGPGALEVVFTTLGEPLVTKLEAAGRVPSTGDRYPDVEGRLVELQEILIAKLLVRVDRVAVPLRWLGISRVPDGTGKVAIRLSGQLPAGAATLSWTTDLIAGTYPLAFRREGAAVPTSDDAFEWLTGTEVSREYDLATLTGPSRAHRFVRSILTGFDHIVPKGLDHILFVLGLFLLAARRTTVLMQVTAFTVAHSITLALSLYGVVALPVSIVEPLIALSIVYVAFENLFTSTLTPRRLALVFAFGLLHGLGFAEALTALDLPRAEFLSTLIAFNLGVEAGQLTVILAAAVAILAMRIPVANYHRLVVRPASLAIALVGVYGVIERILVI